MFLISVFFTLSSCEKDLYDETLNESNQQLGKINYVKIDDVPFLKPSIEKYKHSLRNIKNSIESNRSIEDLNLDLDHIIEYMEASGFKSYSIAIKKEFDNNEDIYFENLHIIKVDGDFKTFIAKYNATIDSKEFKAENFTGQIELYTIDSEESVGIIEMQNGQKMAEPAPPTPSYPDEPSGSGGDGDPPSWMPTWLAELFGYWNGNPHSNNGSNSGSDNSSGNGGVFIIIPSPGGPVMGEPVTLPVQNTSGGNTVIVPNEPQWTYPTTQHMMENRIEQRLSLNSNYPEDLALMQWLENPTNDELIENVYFFLYEEENTEDVRKFTRLALNTIKSGGEVDFPNRIIYTINKPCQKEIIKNIIATCSPLTELIDNTFNSNDRTNLEFLTGNLPIGNALTYPYYWGDQQNYILKIKLDDSYLDSATNLSIVANTVHELVHAHLINLFLNGQLTATNTNYNTLQNAFITFYEHQVQDTANPLDDEIHNAMIDFIDQIANAIYAYSQTYNIPNVTNEYCKQLAWGTMYNTDLFQTTLTSQQQIDYGNITAIEQDNMAGAIGTPCN
jgi:hypothetical protein